MVEVAIRLEVAFASINMNVEYLHSAELGETISGVGKILRAGKSVLHTEAKIYSANNKILAKATSNLIATSVPLPV